MAADLDPVFKALADRHRRLILDLLRDEGGQTLVRLCAQLDGMTRQAVSKHIAVLEGCGLVVSTRRGREKLHHLNPVPIHEIHRRWISRYDTDVLAALDHLKDTLQEGDRHD
ncbi:MAG TPA: metalloregulator ArsR/SmtB family transcription factor [Pseudonocardiaceae bacterium]|nr:metalloregulator ArsR/SmtB family transcription factor [Pseudonocardiaceae bacterium]